jgi:hypothetical protein
MMSRPLITELPACGPSRGDNHPKTLRGPVGKERPAGPRSHTGMPAHPSVIPAPVEAAQRRQAGRFT